MATITIKEVSSSAAKKEKGGVKPGLSNIERKILRMEEVLSQLPPREKM